MQDVAQSLSNNGWSIDAVRDSLTPLSRGVQAQHHELVSLLLDRKADFNRTDSKGVHPVHMAVFGGNQDIIRQLICAKVDVNSQDRHGQTPLFFAPCKEICQQLSAASANVHALNSKGQSPLHLAAFAGLSSVVSWLVVNMKQGAIDQQDKHGRTALYCAMRRQQLETVTLLHEYGADLTLRPSKGSVPSTPGTGSRRTEDARSGKSDQSCRGFVSPNWDWIEGVAKELKRREEKQHLFVKQASLSFETSRRPVSALGHKNGRAVMFEEGLADPRAPHQCLRPRPRTAT